MFGEIVEDYFENLDYDYNYENYGYNSNSYGYYASSSSGAGGGSYHGSTASYYNPGSVVAPSGSTALVDPAATGRHLQQCHGGAGDGPLCCRAKVTY